MMEQISITFSDGSRAYVEAELVGDWLGVHPHRGWEQYSGRWTVTHVPSGLSACLHTLESREAAQEWACRLPYIPGIRLDAETRAEVIAGVDKQVLRDAWNSMLDLMVVRSGVA